jgi:glutamate--cysteine ligase
MIAAMRENNQTFYHFAMDMCEKHHRYFQQDKNTPERIRFFEEEAEKSLQLQQEIEAADDISFDEYLARYLSQS